ncbi:MAG: hypothetical protein QOD83_3809 [Solirubrobacteraceae bacterium]|jgi:hypothetical protein|nr:hypothetical protein [Solirubrobacteraceae bacterium]
MTPRVLFVTPGFEDYLSDGILHGLRELLGAGAIDFPKQDVLYAGGCGLVRGGGFTLYGLLDDLPLDRHRALFRAEAGEFDLVVFGDIWRTFGLFTEWGPRLHGRVPVAVLDGADRVEPYPYGGFWWRRRSWWALPRAHTRATYFKREITPWTGWFRSYLLLPPPLAARSVRWLRPTAFSVPAQKIVDAPPEKDRDFATHVVDAQLAPLVGGSTSHVFTDEDAYRADLQRARFGVTCKREGWDCLRHYEIAANGAVPCFRDLHRKPATCAPHGLRDGVNCLAYSDPAALLERIAALPDETYSRIQAGALRWARANTTVRRAEELLAAVGMAPGPR